MLRPPCNGTSIKLRKRGTLVEGDMVGLGALDLILRSVRARMMGVTVDLEIAGTHADDRAADTSGLGIPAHAIMDLEALGHGRRSDAAEELQKGQFSHGVFERHGHFNRITSNRFREIAA